MTNETLFNISLNVRKRNGQIVAFNGVRIKNAIGNAFKEEHALPREADLPVEIQNDVEKVTHRVLQVLRERTLAQEFLSVEEIQDEVIRQLYENGYKEVGERYASYRKLHAARRALFELYSTIKRDGRVVSFKPEKITMAIAKAFRAHSAEDLTVILAKAHHLTTLVVEEIHRLWPEGKSIHIEEIQDLVEKTLLHEGFQDIANKYIQYREERAKIRPLEKQRTKDEMDWAALGRLTVQQEDGSVQAMDVPALRSQIESCCAGLPNVSAEKILKEAVKNYFSGMTEEQMFHANIMAAKTFLETEPEYSYAAARLLLLAEYEETLGSAVTFNEMAAAYPKSFESFILNAVELELLSPALRQFDLKKLGAAIVPQRDFLLKYMGLQTLYDRYFLHWEERRLELPQIFWMRVAMGLAKTEKSDKEEWAIRFYELLSTFRYMSSTPTLFNSGTNHSQLSSCFLTTVEDDLTHIFKCIQDDALLSKWSGGLGNDWTNVRSMGARIKGTNGRSQGIVPFLKVANDTAVAVNQGGKRQGAMCAYLETWHLDIEEFLELRKNTGDDRRRTHDMHTANWIPDLFMKRVRNNQNWTLFSPNEVPDLHHLYGQAFEQRYEEYEAMAQAGTIKCFKIIPAIALWRKMLNMLFETGHPWLTWKDPSNIRSPQDHVGVVHSSNLCTEILLNTSQKETAVCNLGSINLANHVTADGLDHPKLRETIRIAVRMLDNVIDINYYPTVEARNANQQHRPIGLGLMGFQDALFIQNMSYASQEAVEFADESMEAISYYTILASIELAKERGPYSTYPGSKWERGFLPLDTLDLLEQERGGYLSVDRSSRMDWTPVRKELKAHGLRNSLLMAIAPTATIGNIVGVTASIEPIYKNIFVKSNLSGEFTVANEDLVKDLKKLGLWDNEMIDDLKYFDGSIQEIARIPEPIKRKYVTAFEIDYEWIIEAASRRQKWIDMGQSLNLYQAKPSGPKVSQMYMFAWEKGLKTTYYLRSMGATRIEKSTLDITQAKYVGNIVGGRAQSDKRSVAPETSPPLSIEPKEDCEACQ